MASTPCGLAVAFLGLHLGVESHHPQGAFPDQFCPREPVLVSSPWEHWPLSCLSPSLWALAPPVHPLAPPLPWKGLEVSGEDRMVKDRHIR